MIAPADWFVATDDLDPILRRIVGRKVRSVVRSGIIAAQDAADFEQDLYVRLLASATVFDPGRSHHFAFATMVVDRAASKLLRDRQAQKRNPARAQRLNADVAVQHEAFSHVELEMDVASILAGLPSDLRTFAERLQAAGISELARESGTSRSVLYRAVHQLRRLFANVADAVEGGRCHDGH